MNEEFTDERLIALLEGSSDPDLEAAIKIDPNLKNRYDELAEVLKIMDQTGQMEVPIHIGMEVQKAIQKEKRKRLQQSSWMQIAAAAALLVLGFSAGRFSESGSKELAVLRNEIRVLQEITLAGTLKMHSASERIQAVNQIEEQPNVTSELVSTLIKTLNADESPNVRYAALQALKKFIDEANVRAELVKSIESQSDPLILISLITMLVEAEEKSAIAPLKDLIDQQGTSTEVIEQAKVALKILI